MLAQLVSNIFYFYGVLIIIRSFLTWIPTLDWDAQPIKTLRQITDVYLDLFRSFIPPVGGLDFSPIVALIVLQIISTVIVGFLA